MTIGEKIKTLRLDKGLSQKQLGQLMGVSQQMIAQYEKGAREPKLSTLEKFADSLEVPLDDLVKVSPGPPIKFKGDLSDLQYFMEKYPEQTLSGLSIVLKEERKKAGLSQQEISSALNIDIIQYQELENRKKLMDLNSICRIIKYFNIPVYYLLGSILRPLSENLSSEELKHLLNSFDFTPDFILLMMTVKEMDTAQLQRLLAYVKQMIHNIK